MGNSVGSRYRYGASFVDRTSGVRFEGHHPVERPDLWKIYLNEAEGRYRNFGIEDALRRQDPRRRRRRAPVLPGLRRPWRARGRRARPRPVGRQLPGHLDAGDGRLTGNQRDRVPDRQRGAPRCPRDQRGLVEGRGGRRPPAWPSPSRARVTHAMNWLGAEFAIAAVSDIMAGARQGHRGQDGGHRVGPLPGRSVPNHCPAMAPLPQSGAVLTAAPEGPAHRGGAALPRPHAPGLGSGRARRRPGRAPGAHWSWT